MKKVKAFFIARKENKEVKEILQTRSKAINELKNTALWNEVYAESKTWLNDGLSPNQINDKIQREILARAVENEYKALSKNVLKRIYAFFANLFGITRGLDFIVIVVFAVMAYIIVRLYYKLDKLENDINKMVKEIALSNEISLSDDED